MVNQRLELRLRKGSNADPNVGDGIADGGQLEIEMIQIWLIWSRFERSLGYCQEAIEINAEFHLGLKRCDSWVEADDPRHEAGVAVKTVGEDGSYVLESEACQESGE